MKTAKKERVAGVTAKHIKAPIADMQSFVEGELDRLVNGRNIVSTPECQEDLVAFARANGGSMDILLMQMAIQYGAKLAYENILDRIAE